MALLLTAAPRIAALLPSVAGRNLLEAAAAEASVRALQAADFLAATGVVILVTMFPADVPAQP